MTVLGWSPVMRALPRLVIIGGGRARQRTTSVPPAPWDCVDPGNTGAAEVTPMRALKSCVVSVVAAAALVCSMAAAIPPPYHYAGKIWSPFALPAPHSVAGHALVLKAPWSASAQRARNCRCVSPRPSGHLARCRQVSSDGSPSDHDESCRPSNPQTGQRYTAILVVACHAHGTT